jgi:hypothetical protein
MPGSVARRSGWVGAAVAVLRQPVLWPVAVRQARRLARPGWWRRPPFLPLPDRAYLRFRMVTAYGGDGRRGPERDDVVAYLRWCRAWQRDLGAGS